MRQIYANSFFMTWISSQTYQKMDAFKNSKQINLGLYVSIMAVFEMMGWVHRFDGFHIPRVNSGASTGWGAILQE